MKEKEVDKLNKQLADLKEFSEVKLEEIGRDSEPVFINSHICNTNLKNGLTKPDPRSGHDIIIRDRSDMISYNTKTLKSLKKLNDDNPEPEA